MRQSQHTAYGKSWHHSQIRPRYLLRGAYTICGNYVQMELLAALLATVIG